MNTSNNKEYAIRNILQSLESALTYCSFMDDYAMREELESILGACQGRVFDLIVEE